MRYQHLIIIGLIIISTIGCSDSTNTQNTDPSANVANTNTQGDIQPGNFQAGEHSTQGQVTVVTQTGKKYLQFADNFQTQQGPDLFVILYRGEKPPASGVKEKDYLSIARLQKTSGKQLYALPANLNLQDYKSVAIWCRQFNVTFGYAIL